MSRPLDDDAALAEALRDTRLADFAVSERVGARRFASRDSNAIKRERARQPRAGRRAVEQECERVVKACIVVRVRDARGCKRAGKMSWGTKSGEADMSNLADCASVDRTWDLATSQSGREVPCEDAGFGMDCGSTAGFSSSSLSSSEFSTALLVASRVGISS